MRCACHPILNVATTFIILLLALLDSFILTYLFGNEKNRPDGTNKASLLAKGRAGIRHSVPANMYHQLEEASRPRTSVSRLLWHSVRRALCTFSGFRKPRACFPTNRTSGIGRGYSSTDKRCYHSILSDSCCLWTERLGIPPSSEDISEKDPIRQGLLVFLPEDLCSAQPCDVKAYDLGRWC